MTTLPRLPVSPYPGLPLHSISLLAGVGGRGRRRYRADAYVAFGVDGDLSMGCLACAGTLLTCLLAFVGDCRPRGLPLTSLAFAPASFAAGWR